VFIDNRGTGEEDLFHILEERARIATARRFIESGDIVFGEVGIERKTINDLVTSVTGKDRHLWEQLKVLKATYKIPLLVVEGNVNYKDRMVSGILSSIVLGWKLPYITTHDIYETADLITALFTRYGTAKTNMYPPRAVIKQASPAKIRWAMLQCVQGIGPRMAKSILGIVPFNELCDTDPKWLAKQIKGLGPRRTTRLIEVFR